MSSTALLQVSGVPNANATVVASGQSITPQTITVSQLMANPEDYESELLLINVCDYFWLSYLFWNYFR